MSKEFTRTIKTYTYPVSKFEAVNGELKAVNIEPFVSDTEVSIPKISKALSKRYPNVQFYVGAPKVTKQTYSISLEDFMKYATPVETKTGRDDK